MEAGREGTSFRNGITLIVTGYSLGFLVLVSASTRDGWCVWSSYSPCQFMSLQPWTKRAIFCFQPKHTDFILLKSTMPGSYTMFPSVVFLRGLQTVLQNGCTHLHLASSVGSTSFSMCSASLFIFMFSVLANRIRWGDSSVQLGSLLLRYAEQFLNLSDS